MSRLDTNIDLSNYENLYKLWKGDLDQEVNIYLDSWSAITFFSCKIYTWDLKLTLFMVYQIQ